MAVPKRRTSRSRTRSRRAQWKAKAPQLVEVRTARGTVVVPRRLVAAVHRFPERFTPKDLNR